jgi:signal transduction histidine kinase/AmiR/NasT family two-component response regulator
MLHARISTKITVLVVTLGLICIGVATAGGDVLAWSRAHYAELTDRQDPALLALAGAERANYQMAYGASMVIVYPGASDEGRAWARSVTRSYAAGLASLRDAERSMPDRRGEIDDLRGRLQENKARLDMAVELALFNQRDEAAAALTQADSHLVAFGDLTHRMIEDGVRAHRRASDDLGAATARTRWLLLAVSFGGVLLAMAGALWMAGATITRPLARLREGMQALAAGDRMVAIEGQGRPDEVGAMARAVQVFKDNALELEAAEAERVRLQEARLRAEASNQAKRDFLANMSHELRTPLNGVLTMAQLMVREPLSPAQQERLGVIQQSGQDLLHVINDILDFSKIEAGKLELEDLVFDAESMLNAVCGSFAAVAEGKGLRLSLEVAPEARGPRRGDPSRLRQIVNNYVSNALKFTETGEVVISVAGAGARGGEGLVIAVRDTGPGVAPDKMDLLFKSFSQVDASTTRQFGGTGLGLAICRELAELMGGRAWAESPPGGGAVFYAQLALPRSAAAAAAPSAQAREAQNLLDRPLRVLAAEDNPTNRTVLAAVLDAFGVELTLCGNGREAVEAWEAGGFDVILMDIQMPEMDGMEATRRIRAAEAARGLPRTPIIALTANAFLHQVDAYAAAGIDDHLAKPIVIPLLQAALERVMSPGPSVEAEDREVGAAGAAPTTSEGRQVASRGI